MKHLIIALMLLVGATAVIGCESKAEVDDDGASIKVDN